MMNSDNPRVKLELESADVALELIGWLAVVLCFAVPIYYSGDLPPEVPSHFNLAGEVDGYSSKRMLYALPIVNLCVYWLLYFLNSKPHLHNYNGVVTPENAKDLYTVSTRFLRFTNVITAGLLLYIEYEMVSSALLGQSTLNMWSVGLYLVLLGVGIFWMLRENSKLKSTQ